jgi:hypothetical protein
LDKSEQDAFLSENQSQALSKIHSKQARSISLIYIDEKFYEKYTDHKEMDNDFKVIEVQYPKSFLAEIPGLSSPNEVYLLGIDTITGWHSFGFMPGFHGGYNKDGVHNFRNLPMMRHECSKDATIGDLYSTLRTQLKLSKEDIVLLFKLKEGRGSEANSNEICVSFTDKTCRLSDA